MAPVRSLYSLASAVQAATFDSGGLPLQGASQVSIDVNVSAISGSGAQVTPSLQRLGTDGVWYTVWTGTAISTVTSQSVSIGPGCTQAFVLGSTVKLVLTIAGSSPQITMTASMWCQ